MKMGGFGVRSFKPVLSSNPAKISCWRKNSDIFFFLALPTERCIKQKMTCQHVERLGSEGPQKGGNSEVKNMAEACRSAEYIVKICFIL